MSPLLVFHLLKFNCFSFFFRNQSLFSFLYFILYIYVFICLMSKILIIEQQKFQTPSCKHKQGWNHFGIGPPTFLKNLILYIYVHKSLNISPLVDILGLPSPKKIYKLTLETHFENLMIYLIAKKNKSMKTKRQCVEFLVNIVAIEKKKEKEKEVHYSI